MTSSGTSGVSTIGPRGLEPATPLRDWEVQSFLGQLSRVAGRVRDVAPDVLGETRQRSICRALTDPGKAELPRFFETRARLLRLISTSDLRPCVADAYLTPLLLTFSSGLFCDLGAMPGIQAAGGLSILRRGRCVIVSSDVGPLKGMSSVTTWCVPVLCCLFRRSGPSSPLLGTPRSWRLLSSLGLWDSTPALPFSCTSLGGTTFSCRLFNHFSHTRAPPGFLSVIRAFKSSVRMLSRRCPRVFAQLTARNHDA